MPLGAIDEDRTDRFLPLTKVFDDLGAQFALARDAHTHRRPGALLARRGHGHAARPDLAADRQFLRRLQPRAPDHRGQALHVPRP